MSDNKRDDLQDYLDLLQEFSNEPLEEESVKTEEAFDNIENEERVEISEYADYEEETPAPTPFKKLEVAEEPVDILSSTPKEKNPFKRLLNWYKNLEKKKKIIVSIIAVILALLIILGSIAGIFVINKFSLLGDSFTGDEDYENIVYDDGEFNDINIDIGSADFKQSLIDWATKGNDSHISSKDVINVLLIGADSRKGVNAGNTDVMMLVSLNKKTKQLKLISFLRDSYLYVEGKKSSYCTKLNAAFSMGGAECLMQTIENNYKIDIDNYVMVNFESFTSIINEMGGITVDVQKYEADYNYKKFKISLPHGDNVTLNGEQALCFCRIRGCDSDGDVSRTRRQRQVIEAIIQRVNNASVSDLNKYIDILLPYVDTGYSKSQIISLGIKAITGKWYNYEQSQLTMPTAETRTSGSANAWIWVVDYQLAAHNLQMEIYGESNITIDEDRTTIIDVYKGAKYRPSASSSSTPVTSSGNSSSSDKPTSGSSGNVTTTESKKPVIETQVTTTESSTESTTVVTTPDVTDVSDTTKAEPTVPVIPEEPTDAVTTEKPTTEPQTTEVIETEAQPTETQTESNQDAE